MKTFNELKIGDYIFHKCKKLPLLVEPKRILNIYEFYNETIFEILIKYGNINLFNSYCYSRNTCI